MDLCRVTPTTLICNMPDLVCHNGIYVPESWLFNYKVGWYNPPNVFMVEKRSAQVVYLVELDEDPRQHTCTCDHYYYHTQPQNFCRHILLVQFYLPWLNAMLYDSNHPNIS